MLEPTLTMHGLFKVFMRLDIERNYSVRSEY
jgi:hypothetical protein